MPCVKWNKSEEGYMSSVCGRFEIEPIFIGRTTPQGYNLYFRKEPAAPRAQVRSYCDTQRDAREAAERLLRNEMK